MRITFEAILQRLAAIGTQAARAAPLSDEPKAPFAIRLRPRTRQFLEAQAEVLGTSLQSVVTMILDGVAEASAEPVSATLRTMRERLLLLLNTHGLDLPASADLLKELGFTLSVFDDATRLTDLLDERALRHVATIFDVRREWLSGASENAIYEKRWYKNVPYVATYIMERQAAGESPHAMFIRRRGANFPAAREDNDEGRAEQEPIGLVFRLQRHTPSGTPFETFDPWAFERWNYSNCRLEAKLLILMCEKLGASFDGCELDEFAIGQLCSGKVLPATLFREQRPSVAWTPDDYASLRFEVTREVEDWEFVRSEWHRRKYDSLPTMLAESRQRDSTATS